MWVIVSFKHILTYQSLYHSLISNLSFKAGHVAAGLQIRTNRKPL